MRRLGTWQIISFVSRALANIAGLLQSFIIVRLLSLGQWGVIQVATSVGESLGIFQHLGLASASTREISNAKSDKEIFQIFVVSSFIRYCMTIPIAVLLFFFAGNLETSVYKVAGLAWALKIYAITLLFQGFQGILNSVVAGRQRFKALFTFQIVIAYLGLFLYIPLVFIYKERGYFYAFFLFNMLSTLILWKIGFSGMQNYLHFPKKAEFTLVLKEIFSISMVIYLAKVVYKNWERMGVHLLTILNGASISVIYAFALLYTKKLMNISDSVTDVNLPVFSEKFGKDLEDFKQSFTSNFNKLFAFIVLVATSAAFWVQEAVYILLGREKYLEFRGAFVLIMPLMGAFTMYSFINIIKSSILVPAKMTKALAICFIVMIGATAGLFFTLRIFFDPMQTMAWSMFAGAVFSNLYLEVVIKQKLGFHIFGLTHWLIILQSSVIGYMNFLGFSVIKVANFALNIALLIWSVFHSKFVDFGDVKFIYQKIASKIVKSTESE